MSREWYYDVGKFMRWAVSHGYQVGLEIDRENNDRGYYPGNCRFVTPIFNQRNRSNVRIIEYKGERHTIASLHEKYGNKEVSLRCAEWRWDKGVQPLVAISMPVVPRKRIKNLRSMPNELICT